MRLTLGSGLLADGSGAPFAVTITGLTGGEARIGDHASIGYTTDPVSATETVKWSNSSNPADAATYGTGSSPTDYTAGDEGQLWLHVTDTIEGESVTVSRSAPIRYAPGSVTESALADWTIDDDVLNVNLASDFTTTNLTGTYVIAGLPSGAVDDGDGTISGTADGSPETVNFTCTFTDQYGRTIVGSYTVDTVYRAQATGGTDLDLVFTIDTTITSTNLVANWTTNGNTLTFVSVSPALPFGSISSAGALTGTTGSSAVADATYTLTMEDEYGRQTSDTFTLEVSEAAPFSPSDLSPEIWYDPSDLSTLWQDQAGTIPVTADGDPVNLIQDKSGNGNDATPTSTGSGVTYRTDGTLHWLEFTTGKGMRCLAASFSGTDEITNCCSVRLELADTVYKISHLGGINSTGEFGLFITGNNPQSTIRGTAATAARPTLSSIIYPQKHVITQVGKISTDLNQLYVDGVKVAEETGNLGTGNFVSTGGYILGDGIMEGRFYQVVVCSTVTTGDDLTNLQDYMMEKAGHAPSFTADSIQVEMLDGALNVHMPVTSDKYLLWRCEDYDTTGDPVGGGPGSVLKDLYYEQRVGDLFGVIHRLTDLTAVNEFAMKKDDTIDVHVGHQGHAGMARRDTPVFTVDGVAQTIGTRANFSPSSSVQLVEKFECYDVEDGTTVIANLDTTKTWEGRIFKLKQELTFTANIDLLTCYMFMLSFYLYYDDDSALGTIIETITLPDQSDAAYTPGSGVSNTYPDETHFVATNTTYPDLSFDIEVQGIPPATFRSWVQGGASTRKFYMSPAGVNDGFGTTSPLERTPLSVSINDTFTLETWVTVPVPA